MSDATAPDPGDEQALAESLDGDKIDPTDYPPEHLLGADEFGITPAEEHGGESVRQRDQRRDHRRDLREARPPVAGLIDVDEGFDQDHTEELVAERGEEPDTLSAEEAAVELVEEPPDTPDGGLPRPGAG